MKNANAPRNIIVIKKKNAYSHFLFTLILFFFTPIDLSPYSMYKSIKVKDYRKPNNL